MLVLTNVGIDDTLRLFSAFRIIVAQLFAVGGKPFIRVAVAIKVAVKHLVERIGAGLVAITPEHRGSGVGLIFVECGGNLVKVHLSRAVGFLGLDDAYRYPSNGTQCCHNGNHNQNLNQSKAFSFSVGAEFHVY